MKRIKIKNQSGFTLIEMMIVLLVISVLLIITIPNITRHNSKINSKGCEAFVQMVQAQVQAYEMDIKTLPENVDDLQAEGYLNENETACPDGRNLTISAEGKVTAEAEEEVEETEAES